ncbi:hypothetical protein TIFTF001_005744 [Ficus carica]|uniref:DDE Tnp4 domain-containing protein n=1 Tax=Ficus carica TaxID=3494 RepID=A0AA88CV94_FICCA|nr:hypothetical protein TIFTF001_005744 [Ficus carica]
MNKYSSASDEEQDDVCSENEYSDHNNYLMRAVVAVTASRRNKRRQPQPMHNSTLTGSMRVEEILNGHAEIIQGLIGATNRHTSYLFQHSIETTSRWFSKVLKVICSLKDEFIRASDYSSVQNLILEHSDKYCPWFDGCIGAIDGTHVPCVPRRKNADAWINRKGYHSHNVLAICSFDWPDMSDLVMMPECWKRQ